MDVCAPVPSATMVITAATPMIMPSIVRAVRILLRPSAFNAIRRIMRMDIATVPREERKGREGRRGSQSTSLHRLGCHWKGRELVLRVPLPAHGAIGDHLTVAKHHSARPIFGDVRLVRDQHDGDAAFLI